MMKIITFINVKMWFILFSIILMILLNFFSPVIITLLLILYGTLICLNMSIWSMNYLYSIIMFLIIISGMMIIFMYFSSIIANEQLKFQLYFKILLLSTPPFIYILYLYKNFYMTPYFMYFYNEMNVLHNSNLFIFNNLINIYNYPFNNLSLLCMIFLLFTLFMVIKICSLHSLPLRKLSKYD